MKSIISFLAFISLFYGCFSANIGEVIHKDYYDIVEDPQNDMSLWLRLRNDSVFVFYCNILENGDYLNCPNDSIDYAGFFTLKNIKDSVVQFEIKNYRFDDNYLVSLKFKNESNNIIWRINSDNVSFLPKTAEFAKRK